MNSNLTILIVDDEPRSRQLISSMLEKLGLKVIEAADGKEAVERFRDTPTDMVLLDVSMPRLDGVDACRQIRKLDKGKDIPILMVTAMADSDSIKRATAAGATNYVTKPIDWPNLCRLVEQYLTECSLEPSRAD